jgi:sec-independent protein translocase protein TatA
MIANILGSDGLIVLIIAVVVLFGGSQLPKLAKNVGAAGHEFRRAQREAEAEQAQPEGAATVPSFSTALPAAPLAATDDRLLVSRTELRQELAKLMLDRDAPTVG